MAAINSVLCELLLGLLAFLAAYGLHMHKAHNGRIEKILENLETRSASHEERLARVETRISNVESNIFTRK